MSDEGERKLRERERPWILPAAWACLILVLTSLPFPAPDLGTGDLPIDKGVHFVLYAVLGFLTLDAVGTGDGGFGPTAARALAVSVAGLAFAAGDELHQAWLPYRDPAMGDWAADGLGLAAGIVAERLTAGTGVRRGVR